MSGFGTGSRCYVTWRTRTRGCWVGRRGRSSGARVASGYGVRYGERLDHSTQGAELRRDVVTATCEGRHLRSSTLPEVDRFGADSIGIGSRAGKERDGFLAELGGLSVRLRLERRQVGHDALPNLLGALLGLREPMLGASDPFVGFGASPGQ